MEKNSLLLADSGFASKPSNGCHLLVEITEGSFSYAILDHEVNDPKVICSVLRRHQLNNEISQAFKTDRFLSLEFASTKIAVQSSSFLFLPEDVYDEKQSENYLSFLNNKAGQIEKHHHVDLKMVTLFEVDMELKSLFPEDTVFFPILSPLWVCLNQSLACCFLVDFSADGVSFLYKNEGQLIFQNSFAPNNKDEFNYFLLLVKQQLSLDQATPVLMQGLVNQDDDYANCLRKYFADVQLNFPKTIAYNELTNRMPQHYFNSLLAIQLCV